MNKNLFLHELRRNLSSLITWTIVICILVSVTLSFYRTFTENQGKIAGMMSILPKGAMAIKGISKLSDMFSILGFYSVNNLIYMMVLGSIYSIVLSSNIILKEEYNKTAEYLLSKPMSRSEIFTTKFIVFFVNVLLLNIVVAMVGLIGIELVRTGPYGLKAYFVFSFYTLLLNYLFGAIGFFISSLVKRARAITTFNIAIVLIFYFIFSLSKIPESGSKIGYLSPFKYVNIEVSSPSYGMDFWRLSYFIGISGILLLLSYLIYKKKDIYT
jgi:ABC-2 type transport system permease protein